MRCVHESQLHAENCFITLTYNDQHLPENGSLVKSDFQKFLKRLRISKGPLRYFHCGEYGKETQRPHYHAILFGMDFADRKLHSVRDGIRLDTSEELSKIWGQGWSTVGNVTFESAAYVARYTVKKATGDGKPVRYGVVDAETGEYYERQPEYATMSRRPGIGAGWFDKYKKEVVDWDTVVLRGREMAPPRYYDNLRERESPMEVERTKALRKARASKYEADNSTARLRVRELVKARQVALLKRSAE